jgi:putative Holliday junction resolvase
MRVLGVDAGARRIGLAISDRTGMLARPLGAVRVAALDAAAVARVREEVERLRQEEDGVVSIVVGLPRRLNGQPNEMTALVRTFADGLARACGLPVALQDERLSSHEAETLLSARFKSWRERKRVLDAASAAVILQDYLDSRPRTVAPVGDDA